MTRVGSMAMNHRPNGKTQWKGMQTPTLKKLHLMSSATNSMSVIVVSSSHRRWVQKKWPELQRMQTCALSHQHNRSSSTTQLTRFCSLVFLFPQGGGGLPDESSVFIPNMAGPLEAVDHCTRSLLQIGRQSHLNPVLFLRFIGTVLLLLDRISHPCVVVLFYFCMVTCSQLVR